MQKHWYDFDLLMSLNVGKLSFFYTNDKFKHAIWLSKYLTRAMRQTAKFLQRLEHITISPNQILSTRRVHITTASMPMELWCQFSFVVVITAYFDKSMSSTAHAQKSFGQQSRSRQWTSTTASRQFIRKMLLFKSFWREGIKRWKYCFCTCFEVEYTHFDTKKIHRLYDSNTLSTQSIPVLERFIATFDRGQKITDIRIFGSHQPVLMLHSLPTCNVTMSTLCVYIKILLNLFKCWHLFFYPYVLFHLWIFQIIFTVHSSNYFFLIKISHRLLDAPRNGLKDVRNHVYVFFCQLAYSKVLECKFLGNYFSFGLNLQPQLVQSL